MATGETKGYNFNIVLSTEQGELPSEDEVRQMVEAQMEGVLDDSTGLECIGVGLVFTYDEE